MNFAAIPQWHYHLLKLLYSFHEHYRNHNRLCGVYISLAKHSDWMEKYTMKFLGSVQVQSHKGNDVLCAAMQKVWI